MAKARKKREKEARKVQRTGSGPDEGVEFDLDGFPILPEPEPVEGEELAEGEEAAEAASEGPDGLAAAGEDPPPAETPLPPA